MLPSASRSVSVILGLFRIPSDLNGGVCCPGCSKALVLHQPDEDDPDRLLGVCGWCSDWFLMDLVPDQEGWVVVPLPAAGSLRDAPER